MKNFYKLCLISLCTIQGIYGQIYVDINAVGLNNGTSWANAYTDLQNAITEANGSPGADDIFVAEGTHLPTSTTDRTISFEIPGNTNVYGGFSPANGAIDLATQDFITYPTILSGDIGAAAVSADNSFHVVSMLTVGTTILLDGLHVVDGNANGGGTNDLGGGIYATNAQLQITVRNCTISNNFAAESGGGFYVRDAINVYVFTTKINFNTSANLGGGFSNVNSELRTENVLFHDNSAALGGGLNYETSSLLFDVEIIGNTFTQNTASTTGSAVYLNNTGEVIFYFINNIFWNNGPGSIDILNFPNVTQAGSNSLYESGPLYGDCCLVDVDPLFTNPATYDFSLQPTSPVVDIGVNSDVTQTTDLNGDVRILDGDGNGTATVDFGAYEEVVATTNILVNIVTGDLEFTDSGDRDDDLTITINGTMYRLTDPTNPLTAGVGATQIDANTVDVPIASVTGAVIINTQGGDDTFTTDFSGGNFNDIINYNGGNQNTINPGDILRLQGGGTFATVAHSLINENDGNVSVAGNSAINYVGLEPVIDNLNVTDRIFSFTGVDETITLQNDATAGSNSIDSTLGESITFTNPTNSLTISTEASGGSGADIINIQGLDAAFNADLTVNGGADDDINFQTNPTSIGSGNFDINAQTITISQNISTTLGGSITLTASQNIIANSGATISAEEGDINFGANTAATLAGINTVAILVNNNATIRTTGTGNIVMTGVAVGDGTVSDRAGIVISNNSTIQTSGSGSITVTGTGGNGTSGNHGILLDSGSNIQSNTGAVTITGTSGQGTDSNTGVYVNSEISTGSGDAIIMGTSIDAAGVDNVGIFVNANIGTNGAGNIDITGTSANGASDAITLFSFDRRITAFGSGTIHIEAVTGPLTGPAGIAPNPGPGPYSIAGFSTITLQGEIQAGNNVTGPGQLPILGFSNNVFSIGDELTLAINGITTPGVDYSQLMATGMTVDITNTILNLVDGLAGPVPNGTTITVIENNGGPIVGTFNGLPNGATVPFNGQTFFINYNGGSGSNDVILTENSLCAAFPANIVYVDLNATGTNDGTSWANAFADLQDAITQINDCPALDTIYVAEGTYLPTTTTDRYTNFNIPGNCSVYGGFSPTNGAIDLGTRDFNAYPTILSGDIGVPATKLDNTYHVVYIDAIAAPIVMDGLTIRDGYVDLDQFEEPIFAKRSGAGLLIETYTGGANLTLNNCTLTENESTYAAGALANTRQNHTINIDNSFFTNNGGGDIGSIFFRGDEVITITNTTISNNNGGNSTMYLLAPVNLTIDNCVFDNNGAQEYNALRVDASGTSRISNSIFRNHNATINGALGLINANMIIENSLFHDNTAARGGAIYMVSSSLEIIGCTFTRNTASNNDLGEAIYVDNSASSTLNITNSILWDNDDGDGIDDEISSDASLTGNFTHSLIKGFDLTASNGLDGTNPANDPLFTNPATNDFTVQTASPVIDLGDNTVVTEPNDLNGNTRIVDGDSNTTMIVDFGAYEAPELADITPPVITCPSDIAGDCSTNPITYTVTATDNVTTFPIPAPTGFQFLTSKNGKSYYLSDGVNDGPTSFANAIAQGGSVAAIVDEETKILINQSVEALAPGATYYIGLNDVTTEGTFEWQSGVPFVYENWLVGEPNGGVAENYVAMRPDGFWVDIGAGFVSRYVLELTGGIEQIAGLSSGFNFPVGTTTNTFVATDEAGNTATCSFNVTITDSTPPAITCPADIVQDNDPGLCGAYVDYTYPIPAEDCDQTNPVKLQQVDEIVNLGFDCPSTQSNHLRIFNLNTEGVTNDYQLESINVGIAFANPAENLTVNIYLNTQIANPITEYPGTIATAIPPFATATVASPASGGILNVPFNIFIPSGSTIYVEVVTPDTADYLMGYLSSNASETAVGYVNCGGFYGPSNTYPAIISVEGDEYLNQTTVQTTGLSPNSLFPLGTTTNTFEVTDGNGNTANCSFNITVNDVEAPNVTCPADISVNNETGVCSANVEYTVTGFDNCSNAHLPGFEMIGFTNEKIYYLSNIRFTTSNAYADAIAQGGFVASIPSVEINTFLVNGATAKNYTGAMIIGFNDLTTEGTFEWQNGDAVTYTNWATNEPNDFGTGEDYTTMSAITGTWNDVSDVTSARYILEINNNLFNQTAGLPSGSDFPVGTTTNTFSYTDAAGNTDSCSFDVTVNDIEAPVAVCQDIIIQLDASGNATIVAIDVDGGSTDNCAVTNYQLDIDTFTCTDIGTPVTVTLTVFDDALNSDSCTAIVTVEDVTAPIITCPSDQSEDFDVNCEFILPDYTGLATVADACDATPVVTQLPAPGTIITGTTLITLTATDVSTNAASCTFNVIPEDTTMPAITCPGDQTEDLDANCEFTLPDYTSLASVTDGCDSNPIVTQSPPAGTIITVTTTITIFAEDASGNINSCTFDVIPVDTIPPTITCPADLTEVADTSCMFTLPDYTGLATTTDNCGSVSVTQIPAPGTLVGQGNTIITLEASDGTNTSDCTFTVFVEDTTPPTAICQAFTAQLDAFGTASILPTDVDGGSTDNCSIASMSVSPNTFTCADVGTQTVTLTVTDTAGNSSTCDAIVTVEDNIPPTAVCQDISVTLVTDNSVTILPGDLDGGSSDNCSIASITASQTTFTCDNLGPNTVTVTVTDVNGNTSTCIAIVTVSEDIPPIAVCQPFTAQLDATGTVTILPGDADGGSTDNCGIETLTISQDTFDCSHIGENTIILTVTDASGNSSSCTTIVTVEDTVAPDAVCQDITVQLDASGTATIIADDVNGGSSDACGISTIAIDIDTFDCSNVGPNDVTLTVTDVNGNINSCIAVVTVEEENAIPMAVCQNITVPLQLDGTAVIEASDINAGSTGGGCVNGITIDIDTFDCGDVGTPIQVTLSVTNGNGDVDTCIAFVNVVDTLDPEITCPEDQIVITNDTYELPDYVALGAVFAEDNCLNITEIIQNPPPGTLLDIGAYNINFIATDPSGNEASCSFRVTIETILGIPAQTSLTSITVFPNPANDFINIANPYSIELATVQLYDVTGRLIKIVQMDHTKEQQMDISELASATYLLLITSENGQITKQIVKE